MYSKAREYLENGAICPLCRELCFCNPTIEPSAALYICKACGEFLLGDQGRAYVERLLETGNTNVYKVSHWVRTISERSAATPRLSREDIDLSLEQREPSVQAKLNLLLKHLGNTSNYPGDVFEFDVDNDYTLICSHNTDEVSFYLNTLTSQGMIGKENVFSGSTSPNVALTASGWQRLGDIEQSGFESSNAFIAMSFDSHRNSFSKAISAAVRGAGYNPIRVDQVEHVNRIDDEIIAQIRSSKFPISDFTDQRNGVYFEAGFMLGLGRTVIWLCERDDLKNVHFDARQYNTIDYIDEADLQKRLQLRIEAILGKGPRKPA